MSASLEPFVLNLLSSEAPRYTSYPSAHHFKNLSAEKYINWLQNLNPNESIALYVHIPFCQQLCYFCGCHTKVTNHYEPVSDYVRTLTGEIQILKKHLHQKPKLHCLHFGGGSPTILKPEDMHSLFNEINSVFEILPDSEIAIEIDPRRLTEEKAKKYAELGFNRASLGVQDFNQRIQKSINRIQPYELVSDAISLLRNVGINSINLDLLYGLPFQTIETLDETLSKVVSLSPDRIAYFSYAHVPWVKKHMQLIPDEALPDAKTKSDFYLFATNYLKAHNYSPVGIDHFAKPNDKLIESYKTGRLRRNFMGYTDLPNDLIIGIGASSISGMADGIAQNVSNFDTYKKTVAAGELPTIRGWEYNEDDLVRRAIINKLMCYFEADIGKILLENDYDEDYFDEEISQLDAFAENNIIVKYGREVEFISPLKMLIRSVAACFDPYTKLPESRYSKVA